MNVTNFYELEDVKKLTPQYENPCYDFDTMPLKHPNLKGILLGSTGSGKSNTLLRIISKMSNTYKCIIIFCQNKHEPLYEFLEDRIPYPALQIYEGIDEVQNFDFDNLDEVQTLIVFDDMCVESEKKQKPICDLFIRGRKMCGGKGISLVYLTQQYFKVPKVIRGQCSHLFIRKINGIRDMGMVLRECSGRASQEQMLDMYEYACPPDDITQFFMIDLGAPEHSRFRKNFDDILDIEDFGYD